VSEEVAGGDVYVAIDRRDGHGWCFGRSSMLYMCFSLVLTGE
jgi:hypothetical protein